MKAGKDPWRVVYVSSRQEKKVAEKLRKKGIDNYLPLARKLQNWSDRKKWVDFPMFNGYLFVKPTEHQVEDVLFIPGVVAYLKFERQYAVVTEREIDIIKKIEESGYFAETIHTPDQFEEGEEVLVMEGPLKGHTVFLVRKNNEKIFLVSFDTMNQSIKVNMPYEFLKKIKKEAGSD